jgi:hypothetical protein
LIPPANGASVNGGVKSVSERNFDAVFRAGTPDAPQSYFFYRPSGTPEVDFRTATWESPATGRCAADYDGDGKNEPAVFRDGVWYILESSSGQMRIKYFGLSGDRPGPTAYLP